MGNLRLRSWKPKRQRCLRTYERVAYQEHTCWNCSEHIKPGDFYKGEVWVGEAGLTVMKFHENPHCENPWDEEEEPIIHEHESDGGLEVSVDAAA